MDATGEQEDVTVVRAPELNRYELRVGDEVAGFAEYIDKPNLVVFTHTVVDEAYGGRGFGSKLAKFALNDVIASGKRIMPVCPFIAAYLRKHDDWDEHVDTPS